MTGLRLIKFLRFSWRFLIVLTLVFGLGGFLLTFAQRTVFETSQTFFVKRQTTVENKQFYTYDGYYSAQSAERFADSLFGALGSSDVLRIALAQNRRANQSQISSEINKIKIRRLSPQLVNFAYRSSDLKESEEVVTTISGFVSHLVEQLNSGGDTGIAVSFISQTPLIITHQPNQIINSLVGAISGGFAALLICAGIFYLKGE